MSKKKWNKICIILTITIFIFLICRYIENIISLINDLMGTNISYINGIKIDKLYDYRYSAPIILLVILLIFQLIFKNFRYIKSSIQIVTNFFKTIIKKRIVFKNWIVYCIRGNSLKLFGLLSTWQSLFLLGIIVFCIVNNYIILKQDTRPLVMNSAYYLTNSLSYYSILRDLTISNVIPSIKEALYITPIPPLFMLTALPFYYVLGKSVDTAVISQILYMIILIFSVYGIGKHFYNKKVGVLAAFITITMPGIMALSRTYRPDLSLTAMTTLSFYMLLLTNNFKNKKYSVLFGIIAGLSFFTKMSNIVFFITITGIYSIFKLKLREIKIKNIALAVILLLIIAVPWHIIHKEDLVVKTYNHLKKNTSDDYVIEKSSWINQGFIFPAKFSISYLYTLLLFLALATLFFCKKKGNDFLLLGWIFIPYVFWFVAIFEILSNNPQLHRIYNYTLPCLPAIALFTSSSIFKLKIKEHTRWIIICIIIASGIFQYVSLSYSIGTKMQFPELSGGTDYGFYSAKQEDWRLNEIINSIGTIKNDAKPIVLVASISPSYSPVISSVTIQYIAQTRGKELNVIDPVECLYPYKEECGRIKEYVLNSDYIITSESENGLTLSSYPLMRQAELIKVFNENSDKFELIKKIILPDDSVLSLYKRY